MSFLNWLKAKPWMIYPIFPDGWRYKMIYESYRQGWFYRGHKQPPSRTRRDSLIAAITFPHVHEEDED